MMPAGASSRFLNSNSQLELELEFEPSAWVGCPNSQQPTAGPSPATAMHGQLLAPSTNLRKKMTSQPFTALMKASVKHNDLHQTI